MSTTQSIVEMIKEGLSAWKKFIETRQDAYNRKMDRNMRRAIDYGEKYIRENEAEDTNEKLLIRYSKKFFRYNN